MYKTCTDRGWTFISMVYKIATIRMTLILPSEQQQLLIKDQRHQRKTIQAWKKTINFFRKIWAKFDSLKYSFISCGLFLQKISSRLRILKILLSTMQIPINLFRVRVTLEVWICRGGKKRDDETLTRNKLIATTAVIITRCQIPTSVFVPKTFPTHYHWMKMKYPFQKFTTSTTGSMATTIVVALMWKWQLMSQIPP